MAGENGRPEQGKRPGDSLSTLDIITNIQTEQQRVKANKQADADKAKLQKQLQEAVFTADTLTKARSKAYVELSGLEQTLRNFYDSYGPPPYDAGEQSNLNNAITNINAKKAEINQYTTRINTADTTRKSVQNQLITNSKAAAQKVFEEKKINTTGTGIISGSKKPIKPAGEDPKPTPPAPLVPLYTYNAPMVRTAYFRGDGPQSKTTDRAISDAGNYEDAQNMYTPTVYDPITGAVSVSSPAAKGTFQMYRRMLDNTQFYNKVKTADSDVTMYGFKFLYNPTEVSMSWGIAEGFNPEVTRSGADGGIGPVGAGIDQSTVDFTLLLNRLEDMKYIDSNGLRSTVKNPYPGNFNNPEDLKMIYKKGTMYDIEYLFRTINGPNAIYQSGLNDKTADQGFLIGARVELHLGDGLRYLVRLGSLSINHTVFNDRMVPLLSNVQISCHRFYDIPEPGDR
jgi:hypothetical protein